MRRTQLVAVAPGLGLSIAVRLLPYELEARNA